MSTPQDNSERPYTSARTQKQDSGRGKRVRGQKRVYSVSALHADDARQSVQPHQPNVGYNNSYAGPYHGSGTEGSNDYALSYTAQPSNSYATAVPRGPPPGPSYSESSYETSTCETSTYGTSLRPISPYTPGTRGISYTENAQLVSHAPTVAASSYQLAVPQSYGDNSISVPSYNTSYGDNSISVSSNNTNAAPYFPASRPAQTLPYGYSGDVNSLSQQLADVQLSNSSPYRDPPHIHGHITANNHDGQTERLDPRYMVVRDGRKFFKIGRVFKCIWSEPAGHDTEDSGSFIVATKFGNKVYSKIRHFVVVSEQRTCSQCIPMFTYNGQATRKRGVNPYDYAAVFPEGGKPRFRPGEKLIKESFPIKIEEKGENIDPMSRLNFSRVYTVEHNVKVFKVGRIPDEYLKLLKRYFLESVGGVDALSEDAKVESLSNESHGQRDNPLHYASAPQPLQAYTTPYYPAGLSEVNVTSVGGAVYGQESGHGSHPDLGESTSPHLTSALQGYTQYPSNPSHDQGRSSYVSTTTHLSSSTLATTYDNCGPQVSSSYNNYFPTVRSVESNAVEDENEDAVSDGD